MNEYTVVSAGTYEDGNHWARIQKEQDGFRLRAYVHPIEKPKEGDKMKIPTSISIKWEA